METGKTGNIAASVKRPRMDNVGAKLFEQGLELVPKFRKLAWLCISANTLFQFYSLYPPGQPFFSQHLLGEIEEVNFMTRHRQFVEKSAIVVRHIVRQIEDPH